MKKFLVAAALGTTLLAAPAFAQGGGQRGAGMFAQMDANKDGTVTKEEYDADIAARFAKIDTNKDGKISADERTAAGPRAGRGVTDDMTLADMQAMAAKRFNRLDANHDGKIDKAEIDAMIARMGSRKAPPPGGSETN